ncbi:GNAT family N-acetyltransferase [Streptomyces sp. NPDC051738]|uniref:GNAT family N-acetyltransferase n=1 Tax=Streptomyces sp. NPDC051738 TaxID=3365672 RepID=UPI0037CD2BE5
MTHAGIRPSLHALPDLHGHGLRLRPWDPEPEADVDVWFRGRTDPEFRRWNTPLRITTDLDSARDSLCDVARNAAEGTSAPYCVTDATTGAPLGHIGVNVINRVVGSARVGYWVLPEAAAVASPRTRSPSSPAGPSRAGPGPAPPRTRPRGRRDGTTPTGTCICTRDWRRIRTSRCRPKAADVNLWARRTLNPRPSTPVRGWALVSAWCPRRKRAHNLRPGAGS